MSPSGREELRLELLSTLDAVRDEWIELAEKTTNIFATWEWSSLWWRHFGRGRPLLATACRDAGGELVAVVPLYLWSSRPFRVVRLLGHGPGDQQGPICAAPDRAAAADALLRVLAESRFHIFVGEQVRGDEGWSELLGAKVLRRDGSPILRFAGQSWEEVLALRSANFRQQVGRRERKLARDHDLGYRLADDPDRLQEDLDTLFRLHAERWRAGGSDFGGANEAFHREFAACALERGWLRLRFLELDGKPVAAWYGLRYGATESYYQAGRDPASDRYSVGFVLLAHSIRRALEDGMSEYRFLRGFEGYKYRFADDDPGVETVGLTRGLAARVALAAAGLRRRA